MGFHECGAFSSPGAGDGLAGSLVNGLHVVPIYYYTRVYFRSPAIKGWKDNLLGYVPFKDLYIEEDAS